MSLLEDNFNIKLEGQLVRKPIGFVMRGGFSQARGKGMAFGVINIEHVKPLIQINENALNKNVLKGGKIALFRKPNSLIY